MRIERLEISGFKSFPDEVALELGAGATAVVGPNGCGKSNIADAVFWVLGELGAGTIRARGKDLIFSGSALRSPLGVAEVRLQVGGVAAPVSGPAGNGRKAERRGAAGAPGADPAADGAAREVIVTRRVDTTGQSTYEMDGRRCKRRDIQRLFAGTGLGPGSYALIEQGRANEVLSRKPEELRQLVEEAAGLGPYRLNGRESEANLRAAEKALSRVRERLAEVDRGIRVARRDARTARRVRRTGDRIRLLGIAEQAARREALAARIREGTVPAAKLKAERGRRVASLGAFEGFIEEIRRRSERAHEELREAARRIGDMRGRRAQAHALLTEGERAASLRARQRARLDAEERDLRARIEERDAARRESARRAREFPERLAGLASAAAERAAARDAALAEERRSHLAVVETRREVERLGAATGALRRTGKQYEAQKERIAAARLGLAGAQTELEGRIEHSIRVHSEADSRRRAQEEEAARLAGALERAGRIWQGAVAEAAAARRAEAGAQRDLDALRARLRSLRALVLSREQLGAGASRLLEAARRKRLPLRGAVGEAVEVDRDYEFAAERVLGVHRIRVERAADLLGLVEELGGDDAGPCEVLVSELVEAAPRPEPRHPEGTDRLREHVAVADAGLGAAIPDAAVVPDLRAAFAAYQRRPALYVTRTGASVTPPGIVRFGRGGPGEGFLAARREAAELENEQAGAERRLAGLSAALAAADEAADRAERALEEIRESHRAAEALAGRARLASERSAEGLADLRRRSEELAAEVSLHAEDARRNDEAAAQASAALGRDRKRLEEISRALGGREEALVSARRNLLAGEREWQESDRELTRLGAVAEEVRGQSRALEEQAHEDRKRLAQIVAERAALAREEEQWKSRRASALSEESAADSGAREWEVREGRLTRAAAALRVRLEPAVEAARMRRRELDAVEDRFAAVQGGVREARGLLRDMESEFRRAQGSTLDEEAARLPAALLGRTRASIAEELRRMKEEMENLGPVNEIAEVRLAELGAEREEQAAQLRDVEEGIADGLKAMRRQEREARRVFREAFEAVSAGFDRAFGQLFGGGRAELRLVEGPAVGAEGGDADEAPVPRAHGASSFFEPPGGARSGVGIAAQPPGKKLQSVRLLSGGEKAMTAIAFLIALFRYRPAPFCLLDEVDAPLDDANVQRFAGLLAELKKSTQLVVITHNRLTMEACEHLYGVTMEEPGVSRLVSVRLGDAELRGWIAEAAASPADEPVLAVSA